jgi:hypothetical protein
MAFNPEEFLQEVEDQLEPKQQFEVNFDGSFGIAGPGYFPPEKVWGLEGLKIDVEGINMLEGEPCWVLLDSEKIAKAQLSVGNESDAAWWQGRSDAFKQFHGLPCEADKKGRVLLNIISGNLIEIPPNREQIEQEQRSQLAALLAGMLTQREHQKQQLESGFSLEKIPF